MQREPVYVLAWRLPRIRVRVGTVSLFLCSFGRIESGCSWSVLVESSCASEHTCGEDAVEHLVNLLDFVLWQQAFERQLSLMFYPQ